MTAHRKLNRRLVASLTVALALGGYAAQNVAAAPAAAASAAALSRIHIDNFGVVDDLYYRGAQPDGRDYGDLAGLGVKTVIDLTRNGRENERGIVERAGMNFYRIPLSTSERPSEGAVKQFLSIVNDPANQPVYVHCQGGQHRTGVMTAVYRMTKYGWDETKAYDEMKHYKFGADFLHSEFKDFVMGYPAQVAHAAAAAAVTPKAGG